MEGIDYSQGRVYGASLKKAGYGFAMRYLWFAGQGNSYLTADEVDDLLANGMQVGPIWETVANRASAGWDAGVYDAQRAQEQVSACGIPNAVIWFTIDFDASEGQQGAIKAYFDGAASVVGRDRVGCYAGYWPLKRLFDSGTITYGWQTRAWSGQNLDPRAHILQEIGYINVAGIECDKNIKLKDNAGLVGDSGVNGVSSSDLYNTVGVSGITNGRNLFDATNAFEAGVADRFNKVEAVLQGVVQQLNNIHTGGTEGTSTGSGNLSDADVARIAQAVVDLFKQPGN